MYKTEKQIYLISLTIGQVYLISTSREAVRTTLDQWVYSHLNMISAKSMIKSIQPVDAETIKKHKTKRLSF